MFEEVLRPIDEVSENVNYWLVRTDSGNYYDYFYSEGFIAIGWNYITLHDLQSLTKVQLREKIARSENLNLENPRELAKSTLAANKLLEFRDLKKGDVIVIPSKSSSRLAFGTINDDGIYTEVDDIQDVEFYKRRKVTWHAEHSTYKLDPAFFKMIHSHHVMSNIGDYDKYIDRIIHSVYKKNGFAHISLEVNTNEDVDVVTLVEFVGALQDLTASINESFDFREDVSENSIRLNIQSPGIMEMKLLNGRSLMMLAVILNIMACGNMNNIEGTDEQKREIHEFIEQNEDTLDTIRYGIGVMEVDINRFNNIY